MPVVIVGKNPGYRPELASFAEKAYIRVLYMNREASFVPGYRRFLLDKMVYNDRHQKKDILKIWSFFKLMAKLHPNTLIIPSSVFEEMGGIHIPSRHIFHRSRIGTFISHLESRGLYYTPTNLVVTKLLYFFYQRHKELTVFNFTYCSGCSQFDSHLKLIDDLRLRSPLSTERTIKIPKPVAALGSEKKLLDKVEESPILLREEKTIDTTRSYLPADVNWGEYAEVLEDEGYEDEELEIDMDE